MQPYRLLAQSAQLLQRLNFFVCRFHRSNVRVLAVLYPGAVLLAYNRHRDCPFASHINEISPDSPLLGFVLSPPQINAIPRIHYDYIVPIIRRERRR